VFDVQTERLVTDPLQDAAIYVESQAYAPVPVAVMAPHQGISPTFCKAQKPTLFIDRLRPSSQVRAWPYLMLVGPRSLAEEAAKIGGFRQIARPTFWPLDMTHVKPLIGEGSVIVSTPTLHDTRRDPASPEPGPPPGHLPITPNRAGANLTLRLMAE
jgi:hypothetical protein